MGSMNPNTVLNIRWRDEFQPVLAALDKSLRDGNNKHTHFYARALLTMLREGQTWIRTIDVANRVYEQDKPNGGWILWDSAKWCDYGRPVLTALKSDNPMSVLRA